jgi:hypothetical protein
MMSIIKRHAISGLTLINTEDPLLDDPLALAMLIDVFSERGYHAVVDLHRIEVPEKVDPLISPGGYSYRNASMGSSEAAFHAG